MSLKLFEHNQSAFISVIEMLSVTGKAAVVHPTGTGKSYIGFKLCEEFAEFKEDNSDHLKLLYAIDMLNEGIHVDDIDGVILFRPTVSPIIYKQQIGRALAAGKNSSPVIFDIVNNIENLYSISTIQEEMQVAVSYYRELGQSEYIVNDRFEVIDEVRDAKVYYEEHGDLNIPLEYVSESGRKTRYWLDRQRNNFKNGNLSSKQIELLKSIHTIS